MREQIIAQFAVAIGLKELPAEPPGAQISVSDQTIEVDPTPAMSERRDGDDTSSWTLLQSVQQQTGQQEMSQMVDPELDPETIFSSTISYETWRRTSGFNSSGFKSFIRDVTRHQQPVKNRVT